MVKFNRNYVLTIQTPLGGELIIKPPFTIEFDITRNVLTSANVCSVRVYNLSERNRSLIRKDVTDYGDLRMIKLRAGYGDNLPVIFSGNISQAWSVREGTNMITQIECFDGGFAFANSQTNIEFPAGTDQRTVLATMAESLPGVEIGAIGNYSGQISRGNSYTGSTVDILRDLSGGGFFVDNGKANILGDSECLQGEIEVINSSSGLLGTPVRENTIINFDMIFEPRLLIGQKIKLESITAANFNGFYKVISVKHRGMISESVSGDAITSVGMFYGTENLEVIPQYG